MSKKSKVAKLFEALVLDGGSCILAIDERRSLHPARDAASAPAAPTTVAILSLQGPLSARGWSGSGGMSAFRTAGAAAAANPDVSAIILDVNSPGGTVAGTPETAAAVRAWAQAKPVVAMVDTLAASAAYWIASQATTIVMTPSAEVGSIGVLAVHMDLSAMLEAEGIKTTIVRSTAAPYKAEGNPFEPLSEEAMGAIQGEVDDAHALFVRDVAAGRRTSLAKVSAEFGKGRTVGAQRAVDLGMADRIGSMADVLSGMRTKHAFRKRSALAFA